MCNIFNCIILVFLIWGGLCVHGLRGANGAAFCFAVSAVFSFSLACGPPSSGFLKLVPSQRGGSRSPKYFLCLQ